LSLFDGLGAGQVPGAGGGQPGAEEVDEPAAFGDELVNVLGVMPHFTELAKGVLGLRDIVFFLGFITFCLFATSVAIRLKRA
jgi:hypothetical protein